MKRWLGRTLVLLILAGLPSPAAVISNVLLNAGFESGAGETNIDGWVRFGNAYRRSDTARSGSYAAKLFGNWWGAWNYSGVYQEAPASPGQAWEGSAWLMNWSGDPMAGENWAGVKVEFLDASSNVMMPAISLEKLTASSPQDTWQPVSVRARAPLDTVRARFVALFAQAPPDAGGSAWFDDGEFGLSTVTDALWFAGREWKIYNDYGYPGPNDFSTNCAWVDGNGWLHLAMKPGAARWQVGEIGGLETLGYGEYRWQVGCRLDLLSPDTVVGLFTHEPTKSDTWNEIDFEITRSFDGMAVSNLQYAIQPWFHTGTLHRVVMVLTNDDTTHRFLWTPGDVRFQSYHGHAEDPGTNGIMGEWVYNGPDVPVHSSEVVTMNFYLWETNAPADTQHVDLVVKNFRFTPFSGQTLRDDFDDHARSNTWSLTGVWGAPPEIIETNHHLLVRPGDDWQTAGYVTTNNLHWNDKKEWFVFSALLSTVSVEVGRSGDDVCTVLSLSSEEDNGWAATNSVVLYGKYDSDDDSMNLVLVTKTNRPNNDGDERFSGDLANASSYLAPTGGIAMRIVLGQGQYRLSFRDVSGRPLPVTTNSGSSDGPHQLGLQPHSMHWLIGAMNVTNGRGMVSWDWTAAGVNLPVTSGVSRLSMTNGSVELIWSSYFDKTYAVEVSTNLVRNEWTVTNAGPATPPANGFTDAAPSTAAGFYRIVAE